MAGLRRWLATWAWYVCGRRIQNMFFWRFAVWRHLYDTNWLILKTWKRIVSGKFTNCGIFGGGSEEAKRQKKENCERFFLLRDIKFFLLFSRLCFAPAICLLFRPPKASASVTHLLSWPDRLDEFLHKTFPWLFPPLSKQSICETNNRIFYFYFFWTYWFSVFLCFCGYALHQLTLLLA